MKSLAEMLQEFACICQSYPQKPVINLYNYYLQGLTGDESAVADRYFYWFVMAGEAARDENSFLGAADRKK